MAEPTLNDLMRMPTRRATGTGERAANDQNRLDRPPPSPEEGDQVQDLPEGTYRVPPPYGFDDNNLVPGMPDASGSEEGAPVTDSEVIQWIMNCRREAYDARRTRMRLNNINRDAYMGIQDFSYKQKGQSVETLPKCAVAAEQFASFIKKSLIQYGDWFSVTLSDEVKPYITDNQMKDLMKCFLERMPDGVNKFKNIETVLSDGAKAGLMESLIIFKIYGRDVSYTKYSVEPGNANVVQFPSGKPGGSGGATSLRKNRASRWHLCIDLIRTEDYYPDPTGRGLYEIHEFERDYIDVLNMAKGGAYDLELVKSLKDEDMPKPESVQEQRRPQQRGQDRSVTAAKRSRITITEFWGTILNGQGDVVGQNLLATVANKKYLIRRPINNPLWHDESPFIAEPLIRVPHSVWHKALYDVSSSLNYAINEIFNLILDGGIGSVWGIKQLRQDFLSDPRQVENGIPQGSTLAVRADMPEGLKVLEDVSTNEAGVMEAGMQVYELLDREFNAASLTNDIQLGQLPMRQVKATEIVQSNQSNSVTLNGLCMDLETHMERMLRKAFLTMLQHFDDINRADVVQAIGQKAVVMMMGLSPAERYAMFAQNASFEVNGLSAMLAAAQDFQKLMAFMQAATTNPILMQNFVQMFSGKAIIKVMMKALGINPDQIALTQDEQKNLPQIVQQLMLFSQLTGTGNQPPQPGAPSPQGGAGPSPMLSTPAGAFSPQGGPSPMGGQVSMNAGVNQQIQPLTGLRTT
jgi:hypothetical protein